MKISPPLSLLWPPGVQPAHTDTTLDPQCVRDLELERTLAALAARGSGRTTIRDIVLNLCTDPAVIAYRQEILADLWHHPDFTTRLEALLPDINALATYHASLDRRRSPLHDVAWRLGELEQLVSCVSGLHDLFTHLGDLLQAPGWRTLRDRIAQTAQDTVYQNLARELPAMLQTIRTNASVTIGVNLDSRLRPVAATLLAVNAQKFISSSFLDRLLGRRGNGFTGIGPLHTVPTLNLPRITPGSQGEVNPLLIPLFHDLAQVLDTVCQPIARALGQYATVHSHWLAALGGDVAFYLAAIRLMERLRDRGLPLCRPEIAPMHERVCTLQAGYNLNLALQLLEHPEVKDLMVTNDVDMGERGRIGILTGPNQGGKTTYTHMVGLCHILAQAGLWVPAAQARISPVDNIYTHYPVAEQLEKATGRFGDEAQRLSHIFARATRHSLILLNESLASTSPGESLYIAQDLVRILRRLGVRALFATHLHDLAADVATLNANTRGDSVIVSLVASHRTEGEDGTHRSFKIVPGQPLGRSYAQEIAVKYGISYDQLTTLLQKRGVLD